MKKFVVRAILKSNFRNGGANPPVCLHARQGVAAFSEIPFANQYNSGSGFRFWQILSLALCLWALSATAETNPRSESQPPLAAESGKASYYADKYHGRPTASGELFDMRQFTAAHPRLKFGTVVKVTNMENNRAVVVRINDRGPFIAGRVIDLSLAAAEELQMVNSGVVQVKLEVVR